MSATNDTYPSRLEVTEEVVAVTGGGLRILEVGLIVLIGLLICPPLLILAVVVAMPVIAFTAVIAVAAAAVAGPIWLVRHVRAHHRAHQSTLFLHRLLP
jgi:hypothetical protein